MLVCYAASLHIYVAEVWPYALRETAATNALEHEADITKVQELLCHANYDRHKIRPEDSPTSVARLMTSVNLVF